MSDASKYDLLKHLRLSADISVPKLADLYALQTFRRKWGVSVYVYEDGANTGTYRLIKGHSSDNPQDNLNWVKDTGGGGGITDITYAQLVTKIQAGELAKGSYYRITDYQTVHYILDGKFDIYLDGDENPEINTGAVEPLIVFATSTDTLSPQAFSELYPKDILHYDWNPENWKLDMAFGAFDEQVLAGFKGVIYFRHDTLNDVYMGYDFRKVKFRRWKLAQTPNSFWTPYAAFQSSNGIDPEDYQDFLTFHFTEECYNAYVRAVHIEPMLRFTFLGMNTMLNNNVFLPYTETMYDDPTEFPGYNNSLIEIAGGSQCNTFGGVVQAVKIAHLFFENTIGSGFQGNTIGPGFYNNTIGLEFQGNTIDSEFGDNTIGLEFHKNTIGPGFFENTIGDNFYCNNIGSIFQGNTIGPGFFENTIGSYFLGNTIGENFYSNTIGTSFSHNTIDNNFIMNHVKDKFGGLDFTASTHVYAAYNCDLFTTPDGAKKLSYIDNAGLLVVVNANA